MAPFSNLIKSLPKNKNGKDFLLGDLCGNAQLLLDSLARLNFDPQRDRLISTGNLINKGPDSFGVLKLLAEPWFHAVRGSNESLALAWLTKDHCWGADLQAFILQGGNWIHQHDSPAERAFIVETLERLPLAIGVRHRESNFRVVHSCWTNTLDILTPAPPLLAREAIWSTALALEGMQRLGRTALPPDSHHVLQSPEWDDPCFPGRITYCGHAGHPAFRLQHRGHLHLCSGMHQRNRFSHEQQPTNLILAPHEFWLSQTAQPSLELSS